jgi:hypothetical protein
MTYPLFCSFYTNSFPYSFYIKQLKKTLNKFNLKYSIGVLDDTKSWLRNTSLKAGFIKKTYKANKSQPICWIDADGELIRKPFFLQNFKYDFAVFVIDGWRFNSSAVVFGGTKTANMLLSKWVHYCKKYPYVWDQVNLGYAWWEINLQRKINTLFIDNKLLKVRPKKHLKKICSAFMGGGRENIQ